MSDEEAVEAEESAPVEPAEETPSEETDGGGTPVIEV